MDPLGPREPPSLLHPTALRVLAAVAAGFPSATPIARRLGISRQQVHTHLARLVEAGILEREAHEREWLHRLASKGIGWEERLLVRPAVVRVRVEIERP